MQYLITFLEGITTFISPCILPMLPVYLAYFGGGGRSLKRTLANTLCFVLGFTIVFTAMGAFAGTIGSFVSSFRIPLNIITGCIVIFFGLSYVGVFRLKFLNGRGGRFKVRGPLSSLIFGLIFSLSWTPCIGTFLGSALMLASQRASMVEGIILLLIYSMGLGIPYILCGLLIDRLKGTIGWIKSHYLIINRICGIVLIVLGILMAAGLLDMFFRMFSQEV